MRLSRAADRKYKREFAKAKRDALKKSDPEALAAMYRRGHRTPSARFHSMKSSAKSRGIACTITKEEYLPFLSQTCRYCYGSVGQTGSGVDRIDNTRGYEVDNLVPCCGPCNRLKCHLLSFREMCEVVILLKRLRGGSVWVPVI